jgi:hypothetical protein
MELRGMRATCLVDELPKLKPYPWERVFPSGTPERAMDLARQLLTYDPALRLTASQALQHPFFEGLETVGSKPPSAESRALQAQLTSLFDSYAAARSQALKGLRPSLESSLASTVAQQPASDGLTRAIASELTKMLHDCERGEGAVYSELRRRVAKFAQGGEFDVGGIGAPKETTGAPAGPVSQPDLRQLQQEVARANDEAAAAKAERDALSAQLAAISGAIAVNGENAMQTEGDARSSAPPSHGRRALRPDAQGAPSPVVTQGSMVGADTGEEPQSAPRVRNRSMLAPHLGEDEMGQVTPLGAVAPTERQASMIDRAQES